MTAKSPTWVLLFGARRLVTLTRPAPAQTLTGAIDIHAHSDPDGTPRSIDAIDLAKLAKSPGHARDRAQEPLRAHRIIIHNSRPIKEAPSKVA